MSAPGSEKKDKGKAPAKTGGANTSGGGGGGGGAKG